MRIVIVPSWYPTEDNPINGVFFKEQAKALQKAGHDVTVLYPEIWTSRMLNVPKGDKGISFELEDGIKTYRFRGYNFIPGRVPFSTATVFYYRLQKLYKKYVDQEGKPDVFHAHSCLWAGWATAKLTESENIPFLLTEHSSAFIRGLIRAYEKKEISYACKRAEFIISVGPGLAKKLESYTQPEKLTIIPNIVDIGKFTIDKTKLEHGAFRFFSVAFLNHNKGMDILIQSFAKYFINKPVELVIGGDGQERQALELLAKNLGVDKQVLFLGELDREQVRDEIQKAHVFVLASRFETFGVVFIEALACGKPIISTACGGPEMIVNEINGKLVQVEDIDGLGQAMKYMEENYDTYNAEDIRNDCVSRFSEESVVTKITKLYEQVLRV
ncbi:glycosyltransferase [Bacillus sp. REN16]|uniref:glycosyltransferase n=1 Tax=Bacillus sp. REN16 TaxID=2887296 RepID=UPI001E561440|nr:glycosyltransferase [Bacillus sp. REN16]MCC3356919.1 glycosyltransferase [Bacillus sp. REN16]